ncbi:hypothetical protein MKEN_00719400 [Mycena kentingensis (nom. inval.)]|nr:hypothetical protein MKEN_00719400 [Mycena kentingensis (nom. inval.)]
MLLLAFPSLGTAMLLLRWITVAVAAVLVSAANTNVAIKAAVDSVDSKMRHAGPTILTLMANQSLSDTTLGRVMTDIGTTWRIAGTTLRATAVSDGSTTTHPTNDDIGTIYGDALLLLSTSLSGIKATGKVPGFPAQVRTLDPIVANATRQLNVTLPNSLVLPSILMRDARQFFLAEGFNQTLASLGF